MYTKKSNHKWEGAAFLLEPFKDAAEAKLPSRMKGVQFKMHTSKIGNVAQKEVLFGEVKYSREIYDDGVSFARRFPLDKRKAGFGSHDAPRRDEFMNWRETMRLHEKLEREGKAESKAISRNESQYDDEIARLEARVAEIDARDPGFATDVRSEDDWVKKVPTVLFNIGHTKDGTTPVFLRDNRDRFYSHKRNLKTNKPRHVQQFATESMAMGQPTLPTYPQSMQNVPIAMRRTMVLHDVGHLEVGAEP